MAKWAKLEPAEFKSQLKALRELYSTGSTQHMVEDKSLYHKLVEKPRRDNEGELSVLPLDEAPKTPRNPDFENFMGRRHAKAD